MTEYHFVTTYEILAPVGTLWTAICDFRQYPTWAKGVVSVTELEPGGRDGVGAKARLKIKGRLPFTLTFDATISRVVPLRMVELQAAGELAGVGRWTLQQHEKITTVQFVWDVRTNKRWMNLLAPAARALFRWNHDGVMRAAGQGLARFVGAPLITVRVSSTRTADATSSAG